VSGTGRDACYGPAVIRAILHLMQDQPLAVDLLEEPKPSDIAVVCTNVRTVDGKKPVMIDFTSSTFVFPMSMVRFVEIPQAAAEAERVAGLAALTASGEPEDLEIDEDFLRRVREA
jgi:hypothetical protein